MLILDMLSFTTVSIIRSENNPSITAFIYVTKTLWVHAVNSEHAQSVYDDLWMPIG